MDQKEIFRNGLQAMQRLADGKENHITIGEILQCFPQIELDREQIAMIYAYAEQTGITIDDYELHDTRSVTAGEAELTGEEKEYFQMYLQELENVEPCDEEELEMLIDRLLNGEDQVISRLTEGNLHMVLEVAREYAGRGILIGDLVQEGNLALFMALTELQSGAAMPVGGTVSYLRSCVEAPMKSLLGEQREYKNTGANIAREANRLMLIAMDLEEELGREATITELAQRAQLSEDTVRELVQTSLNAAEFANMDGDEEQGN